MSVITDIGKIQNKSLEFKRQHLWVFSMNGIDSWTVQSAERPQLDLGAPMQVNYLTTYARFQAGRGQWNPINITLNDPIDPSASKSLWDLVLSQWNWETGRVGTKAQYSTNNVSLKLLSPDFENDKQTYKKYSIDKTNTDVRPGTAPSGKFIEEWSFVNAFFTNVNWNGTPVDYDNTDRLKISFTLNYDHAKLFVYP